MGSLGAAENHNLALQIHVFSTAFSAAKLAADHGTHNCDFNMIETRQQRMPAAEHVHSVVQLTIPRCGSA